MPSDSSFAANWSSVTGTGDETVAAPASDVAASAHSAATTTRPNFLMFTLPLALDVGSYVPRRLADLGELSGARAERVAHRPEPEPRPRSQRRQRPPAS